ncbi:MAG: hypothetical protein GXP48_04675 [Acidobacteria bacterium]|nr:hypothetical protein [Acidobacteriota bacterium]
MERELPILRLWSGWTQERHRGSLGTVAAPALVLVLALTAHASRLPVQRYTIADGLPSDRVTRVLQGSRGYLWIATSEGLSRFDGYSFLSFGRAEGLPTIGVNDLLETPGGELWVATNEGPCRFGSVAGDPAGGEQAGGNRDASSGTTRSPASDFLCFTVGESRASSSVLVLHEDRGGTLWVGTRDGLYRALGPARAPSFHRVDLGFEAPRPARTELRDITEGADGTLWVATAEGLARRRPGERFTEVLFARSGRRSGVNGLLCDGKGRLWIGAHTGAYVWPGACSGGPGSAPAPGDRSPPGHDRNEGPTRIGGRAIGPVFGFHEDPNGKVWLATSRGLCIFADRGLACLDDPPELGRPIHGIAGDDAGDLWLASESDGLLRLDLNGIVSFGVEDGLLATRVNAIFESRRGDLCVTSRNVVSRYVNGRFVSAKPRLPGQIDELSWGWSQMTVQDSEGRWWLPTQRGLLRYPALPAIEALGRVLPERVFTTRDGLAANGVFRLFLDGSGDLWIATISPDIGGLARWRSATDTIERIVLPEPFERYAVTALAEDGAGNLWLGFYNGGLLRRGRDGAFDVFGPGDILTGGFVEELYLDRQNRMWIATAAGGVKRVDRPAESGHPDAVAYTTRQGLASNRVRCIVEDLDGRMYFGTARGVDRLDPQTGNVDHLGTDDGLPRSEVLVAHRDRDGFLWFGTLHGVARLDPRAMLQRPAPPIFVQELNVAGTRLRFSPRGERQVSGLRLDHNRSWLEIGFVGISFGREGSLRYQHRMLGLDEWWGEPSPGRTVTYGGLAPGTYTFEVRAVGTVGALSPVPASVSFVVLPPLWQRWWFLAGAAGLLLVGLVAVHRLRAARLVAVERVRTQIATDLHDDLGTALTRISILSAVAERQISGSGSPGEASAQPATALREIGATARGLLDANRELVWSLDPGRDDLHSMIARLRRFAGDTLGGVGISWEIVTTLSQEEARSIPLDPETRRHLYLLLKEAISNIARHSGAGSATIRIEASREIDVIVEDDGIGFDAEGGDGSGNGLRNMRSRARALDAVFRIEAAPGKGTRVSVTIPRRDHWGGRA